MSWQSKRLIFAGGTDWSVEFIQVLLKKGFNIVGILSPPDNKKDRGQKLRTHLLKTEAKKLNISVLQPEKLNDPAFVREFKKIKPDLVVVVAYGKLFPKEILEIPPLGFVNFHPSLLPKLRGPSPIVTAILEGFEETGVSIIKLGEGMDDGPLLIQESVKIDPRETAATLNRKLINLGKKILPSLLEEYLSDKIVPKPQSKRGVTVCEIIKKEDGRIDWQKETAEQIDRKIRALNPQIKTFTFLKKNNQKKRVNILGSEGTSIITRLDVLPPGRYELVKSELAIGTKKNILLISKLQVEGKIPITAEEFVQGYGEDGYFL